MGSVSSGFIKRRLLYVNGRFVSDIVCLSGVSWNVSGPQTYHEPNLESGFL